MSDVPRFMLDTGVFHAIEQRPDIAERLKRLRAAGQIVLVTTHVQKDQLKDAPDGQLREQLRQELTELVPTRMFFWDVTPWDQGEWVSPGSEAEFEGLRTPASRPLRLPATLRRFFRWRDTGDALIAQTAKREDATLVTRETSGRMMRMPKRLGLTPMTVDDFFAWILQYKEPS